MGSWKIAFVLLLNAVVLEQVVSMILFMFGIGDLPIFLRFIQR
jgi:hypothetical protein